MTKRTEAMTDGEEGCLKVRKRETRGLTRFHITIEPIKFCFGFTVALTNGVIIDLLQRNVCYRKYNLSYQECVHGNVSTDIKSDTEATTAEVNMINNVVQSIFPLFLVMFIGPWSDINGRKPFMIWACRGFLVYYTLWALFSFFPHMPVAFFFIPSIPLGMTGGIITIYVCSWSYTCDNFQPEEWTMRFTISVASMIAGNLFGNSLAEYILTLGDSYGFQAVFITSVIMSLVGLLYTTFVLEETIVTEREKSKLIDIEHVKSIFNTVILHPRKGHLVIWLVLSVLMTEIPTYAGDEVIAYMVGKSQYNWTLGRYNLFAALSALMSGFVPVICVWLLMDKLGMSNVSLLLLASFALTILQLLKVISVSEDMFWAVYLLAKSTNCIGACIDTELVDTVSEANVGKAFTFTSILDALSPLIATPIYTEIYKTLLPDRTLQVYIVSFALSIITFLGSLGLFITKRRGGYDRPPEEAPVNDHELEPSKHEITSAYNNEEMSLLPSALHSNVTETNLKQQSPNQSKHSSADKNVLASKPDLQQSSLTIDNKRISSQNTIQNSTNEIIAFDTSSAENPIKGSLSTDEELSTSIIGKSGTDVSPIRA